jgi:radical SAM protein with 4Fe4S-binding SPASM domain
VSRDTPTGGMLRAECGMDLGLTEVKIELTQRCPLACVHCSTSSHRKQSSCLPVETVVRVLNEASELGARKVVFTGGEPLVYEHLGEVIRTASRLGIQPTLYTTGILDNQLTPITNKEADELVGRGIARFIFSVYSAKASVHDKITRYGTFAATSCAIDAAVQTRIPVEIHFVAMKQNFRDLSDVVRLAGRVGVCRVSVLRFVPQGRGTNLHSEALSRTELVELAEVIEYCRLQHPQLTIRAGSPFNVLGVGYTPCNAAQDVLIINHRGEIFPCDAFKNVHVVEPEFGSVLKRPLKEVWEKSVYLNRVRSILDRHTGDGCQSCNAFDGCKSGCLAQKVIRNGWDNTENRDPVNLIQIASSATSKPLASASVQLVRAL